MRVEHHVIRDLQDVAQIGLGEGGAEGMHLAAEGLASEARLVQAAGAGPRQVTRDERRKAPHREGLEREQDLGAAFALYVGEQAAVFLDRHFVDDEAGRGQSRQVEATEALEARARISPWAHRASPTSRADRSG